jgi:hypothetical protein
MGTWGTGVFENDYAVDWVIGLSQTDDSDFPASVLRILGDGRPLSMRECAAGLAAGEVIAASCGAPLAGLPDKVRSWLESTSYRADAQTLDLAGQVAQLILDQNAGVSDGLLAEGDSLDRWLAPVKDLRHRLSTATPGPALQDGGHTPTARRLLENLTAQRGESGARPGPDNDQVRCKWIKVRGGLLFTLATRRGLAVTLDTSHRLAARTGDGSGTGLLRHAPLYVWNPDGAWPPRREFYARTRCQLPGARWHWHDMADWEVTEALIDAWIAADGDDEVIWAGLDREHDILTQLLDDCVRQFRASLISQAKDRGNTEDAAKIGSWDQHELEGRLGARERKRIEAEHERGTEIVRRYRERIDATRARYAAERSSDPDTT